MRKFVRNKEAWEISVVDAELLIIGLVDGVREFDTKTCKSSAAATRSADALIDAKLAEGFVEVDADGKSSARRSAKASTAKTFTRWDCRKSSERRLALLEDKVAIAGRHTELKRYRFENATDAETYVKQELEKWAREGFEIGKPEKIRPVDVPSAEGPLRPPRPGERPFGGDVEIEYDRAEIVLSDHQNNDVPSLPAFRNLVRKLREAKVESINIECADYEPEAFLMKAMAETSLPSVRSFDLQGRDYCGADLGELTTLFECCPNLVHVELEGGGQLDRFTAMKLESLKIWDWSVGIGLGEALAKSRTPCLVEVSLETKEGGDVSAEEARAWLELGAPKLESLSLTRILDDTAFEGVLQARAPRLTDVEVGGGVLESYLEPIVRHGIPQSWQVLSLSVFEVEDADESLALFAKAAEALSKLKTFEIDSDLGMEREEAEAKLRALCPNIRWPKRLV